MGKLLTILGLAAILMGGVIFAFDPSYQQQREDAAFYAAQRQRLELERERFDLELHQQRQAATLPANIAGDYVWLLLAAVVAFGSVALVGDFYRQRRHRAELIYPDAAGAYPLTRQQLNDGAIVDSLAQLIRLHGQARVLAAITPEPVPHSISYAPHLTFKSEPTAPALPEPGAPAALALTLPDVAPLADVLDDLPKSRLAYGVLPDGKPLLLPIAAGYHILSHGDTRSGKTNFLDGLLVQLHHKAAYYDIRLIAGDFKRELAATWGRSPLVGDVETDPTAIAELLEEIVSGKDGVLDRYATFKRLGEQSGRIIRNIGDWCKATGERPRLVFVCVDELNAVLEAADKKDNLAGALKIALQTGAGAGVFVAGGAQYLSAKTFGRDGSKQFVTRAHFGAFDAVAIRTMFGEKLPEEARPLLTGQPGRGLIRTVGQTLPTPFQALRCDEDDIVGAIRLLTADAPTMPRMAETPETLKPAGNASETAETGFSISPEIAQIVRRWRAEGKSKKETISLLWGVKPGGSREYKEASSVYDAIVGARVGA